MFKLPEFWYALVLAATMVAYAAGCLYYYNHPAGELATCCFAYAVYAALLVRVLVARLDYSPARAFSLKSLALFGAGLLPLLLLKLGFGIR